MARVYADAVRGNDTSAFLKEIAARRYDPKHQLSDDYEDKFGVKLIYNDDHGVRREIAILANEMTAPD